MRRPGIVFLLMLVIYQQVGAGLYVHNLLHTRTSKQTHEQHHQAREIKFACSCVDNFLTPFVATDGIHIATPSVPFIARNFQFSETLLLVSFAQLSLRGPPAFIV